MIIQKVVGRISWGDSRIALETHANRGADKDKKIFPGAGPGIILSSLGGTEGAEEQNARSLVPGGYRPHGSLAVLRLKGVIFPPQTLRSNEKPRSIDLP